MTLVRRHVSNRTVAMLGLVPVNGASNPALYRRKTSKWKPWVRGRALQGAEQSFVIRVIVRDVRTTE